MSGSCGCGHDVRFDGQSAAYKRVIWLIIAINAGMFAVEVVAGALAGSMALQADALDFLGDSATYAVSLAVIGSTLRVRATAALIKGFSLGAVGLWVLGSTLWRVLAAPVPDETVMGAVGLLAFAANLVSALLLMRWRDGDANVRSVWLCSRNDAIGNLAVIGAAGCVALSGSAWPDLIVAAGMAGLFLHSSTRVIRQARGELREARHLQAAPAAGPAD
jgi:cation diffusion facilitator family transporter